MKFAICNEMFENRTMAEICPLVAGLGYHGLEIAPYTLAPTAREISAGQRREVRDALQASGLTCVGLHWLLAKTTEFHMTTPDAPSFRRTVEYFEVLLELCHDLGGSVMVIGSPKQRSLVHGQTREGAWQRALDLFRQTAPRAEDAGVTLCLEPLGRAETDFINTVAEGLEMVRAVNHPNFKVHLDVKAMAAEAVQGVPAVAEIIRRVSLESIGHFHVNDPNLYGPGMGELDFAPIAAATRAIGWDRWLSVEVFRYDPDPATIARRSLDCLRRYWE